jgi:DNA-binding MarR family transcriptional regulator
MATKTKKMTRGDYEVLAAFRYGLRQFLHFSEVAAAAAGVTPQQHQALLAIKGFPKREVITIGELAEQLQLRHHSAVGLVDRLVAAQLVVRRQDTKDRRQVYLALTARGTAVLEKLSAAHKEELRRVAPELESILKRLRG